MLFRMQKGTTMKIKWYQYLAVGSYVAGWVAKEFNEGVENVKISWWQYLSLGSFIGGWFGQAAIDGVITKLELNQLLTGIFQLLGLEKSGIELTSAVELVQGIFGMLGINNIKIDVD